MIQPGQALTDKNSKHVQILQMKRQRAYWAEAKMHVSDIWIGNKDKQHRKAMVNNEIMGK